MNSPLMNRPLMNSPHTVKSPLGCRARSLKRSVETHIHIIKKMALTTSRFLRALVSIGY